MNGHIEPDVEYVTATVGPQLFGLPIGRVHDVFLPERITRVPTAPAEVAGVLNLRGRVVTAIDMRRRLGFPPREQGDACMAIGIEQHGESYGLLVDTVGEVLRLPVTSRDLNPANLDSSWSRLAGGVHRLENRLMVVLDVDRILETNGTAAS
jgi:purine-binding chemotaxis protein CheW